MYPVVSAEVNESGNRTNLTDDDCINLADQNGLSKKYPKFHVEGKDTYYVGESFRFHVTWNPDYTGPIHVNLDDCYETTTTSNNGQFYITINGVYLPPGLHFFRVTSEADNQWYYDGAGMNFIVKDN